MQYLQDTGGAVPRGTEFTPMMEEYDNHQLLLMELRDKLCGGNSAELARRIGKDATYVHRLLYPVGKTGRKGIGLNLMYAINVAFGLPRGFWELQSPAIDDAMVAALKDAEVRRKERRAAQNDMLDAIDSLRIEFVPTAREAAPPGYSTMQPINAWEHETDLPDGEFVMVPRLEVHLSAGAGSNGSQVEINFNEKQPQAFRAEWIRQQHLKPKKLAAMTARGNSMEPTIHDGDSLLVDTSQVEVIDGRVYALWYEGGERVKRLYRLPGGGLRIRSDNAADHPEIVLGPEYVGHVRVIGRVVHRSGMGGL
jgi:phage repressor protein C with HTH and peptisase S24 domain